MNLGSPNPRWFDRAVCAEIGGNLWLSDDPDDRHEAALVCETCPVRLDCLDAALDDERGVLDTARATVRGGLTPAQRYQLYRRQRRAALDISRRNA